MGMNPNGAALKAHRFPSITAMPTPSSALGCRTLSIKSPIPQDRPITASSTSAEAGLSMRKKARLTRSSSPGRARRGRRL